jgi:endonuclease-3
VIGFRGYGARRGAESFVLVNGKKATRLWGYVSTATPEMTQIALAAKLPVRYWIEINELLVPFGKHVCTGQRPKCSTCVMLSMCRQVGVTSHR